MSLPFPIPLTRSGSFAVVKRAVSKRTGEEFAIKIIKKVSSAAPTPPHLLSSPPGC